MRTGQCPKLLLKCQRETARVSAAKNEKQRGKKQKRKQNKGEEKEIKENQKCCATISNDQMLPYNREVTCFLSP